MKKKNTYPFNHDDLEVNQEERIMMAQVYATPEIMRKMQKEKFRAPSRSKYIRCPNCGLEVLENNYCTNCGFKLKEDK